MKQIKECTNKAFQVEVMRDFSLRRTRSRIVRLINANPDLKVFITLTFDSDVPSLVEANPIFKKFIKRLKRKRPNLKYIAIPEFQSDNDYYGQPKPNGGAVHYHLLVNFEMASDELKAIWQNGFVKINRIKLLKNPHYKHRIYKEDFLCFITLELELPRYLKMLRRRC